METYTSIAECHQCESEGVIGGEYNLHECDRCLGTGYYEIDLGE